MYIRACGHRVSRPWCRRGHIHIHTHKHIAETVDRRPDRPDPSPPSDQCHSRRSWPCMHPLFAICVAPYPVFAICVAPYPVFPFCAPCITIECVLVHSVAPCPAFTFRAPCISIRCPLYQISVHPPFTLCVTKNVCMHACMCVRVCVCVKRTHAAGRERILQ